MELRFTFNDEGRKVSPECDFCGEEYQAPDIQVEIAGGFEVCPSCILGGPKDIAAMAERRPFTRKLPPPLARVESFRDLPGGVTALKIAEAYQEIHGIPGRRTGKAA